MGQYWIVANLDKKEYLSPHDFGDGAKLMEFGCSSMSTMLGLALLLADKGSNGKGGGDAPNVKDIIGRWTCDRIVIAGGYGESDYGTDEGEERHGNEDEGSHNLYHIAHEKFKNISDLVLKGVLQDEYCAKEMAPRLKHIADMRDRMAAMMGTRKADKENKAKDVKKDAAEAKARAKRGHELLALAEGKRGKEKAPSKR